MKKFFNSIFTIASLITIVGFGLLLMGLGYFLMAFVLNFGWKAAFCVIGLFVLITIIEGSFIAVIKSPFLLVNKIFREKSPVETDIEDNSTLKQAPLLVTLMMVLGACLAMLQHIIR